MVPVPIPSRDPIPIPMTSIPTHDFTLFDFYLLFKQLHVIINTSIIGPVVCISMEIRVFNLFDA